MGVGTINSLGVPAPPRGVRLPEFGMQPGRGRKGVRRRNFAGQGCRGGLPISRKR